MMRMKNILRTMPAKIIIYLTTCAAMILGLISAAVAIGCYEFDLYDNTPEELIASDTKNDAYENANIILNDVIKKLDDDGRFLEDELLTQEDVAYDEYEWNVSIPNNFVYKVTDTKDKCVMESDDFDMSKVQYTFYLARRNDNKSIVISGKKEKSNEKYVTIYGYYEGNDERPDLDYLNNRVIIYNLLNKYKNDAIPTAVASVIVAFVFYITMLCVSARRPNSEEVHPGYFNKVPFDIMLFAALCVGGIFGTILTESPDDVAIVVACVATVFAILFFNGLSMSAAARIKQGTLLKNTLIFIVCSWCLKLFWKIFKWCWNKFVGFFRFFGEVFKKFPLIWKTVAVFCGLSLLELIVIAATWYEMDNYLLFWFVLHVVLFVVICKFALGLRGLQAGGRALASGDFDHKIDTSKLHWDFKEHGENLNHISEGMVTAVEEKMKSERMKTELITNVSHDIKTPLTSIINYTDLIGKEETDNEKIKEYTEVLLRQSERLKRLIEDLVEASKASTGNLEVELAPCEASMFITQIAGEYEEKLNASGLTLVTKINSGSDGAKIMADGRRMLRVFDNLMNNICKYALENSRVYLSLDVDSDVVITFKNTSRTELDMSPEELMERFVRGDQSRNTEGNGLGLSIARSLTELQNGTFDIFIDGDLFKVVLAFPVKE